MANIVFNIAKGRVIEFYNRVEIPEAGGPALLLVPLQASGLETEETARDYDNLSALLAGATNEATDGTWTRKILTNTELATLPAPDDTPGNNFFEVSLPTVTWTALTGAAISRICVCFRPATASPDTAIIPLTWFDAAVTPDGNDLQLTGGPFFRAS